MALVPYACAQTISAWTNVPNMPHSPAFLSRLPAFTRAGAAFVVALSLATCTDNPTSSPTRVPRPVFLAVGDPEGETVTLVGSGSIARCDKTFDEQTGALLNGIGGTVFTTGDNVYSANSADFDNCYGPSWGAHKTRTRPSIGDLDYLNSGAYFSYFGANAGDPDNGYYSYDIGSWHIVVLNSSIAMSVGSAQEIWLKADLAATSKPCVLAYWHFPRFSSFSTGVRSSVKPLWDALYAAQADVVVNGHYRLYERFAQQTPNEVADPDRGIRQFTLGTGGQGIDGIAGTVTPRPNSEVRAAGVYGVLKFTLGPATYEWQLIPMAGQTITDSGDAICHGRPGGAPLPNQKPNAKPGGPYATEKTVTFDGSASRDIDKHLPLTFAWTFGDGTTGQGATPIKTYAADGNYSVSLVVTDALGLTSTPATTTVTVGNLGPEVDAGPDATVQVGTAVTLKGTFMDQGGPTDGPWDYSITWGDGQTSTGVVSTLGAPITRSHTYAQFGVYTARISVTDDDAHPATGSDEALVTVRDPNSVAVLVGAGDIAECGAGDDERTANLLDNIAGTVITLGDNVYLSGSLEEYNACYGPSWGRHKARTKPAVGNHDYATPGAGGYFGYFGDVTGGADKGYYSYNAGEWLVIVLNSASGSANRSATSAQVQWLRALLAASTRQCALAYMHHPQFTSTEGRTSGEWNVIDLWNALYEGGVDVVLAGHDHIYDRFAPMRPDGTLDSQFGILQITNGAGGGEGLYRFGTIHPNSVRRNNSTFGVLKMTLRGGNYSWQFVGTPGSSFTDSGNGNCHGRPGGDPPPNQAPTARTGGPYQSENTVTFNGSTSTDPENHMPLAYYWTFGDGTVGSGVTPTKTYTANGTYTVSLVVTDAFGKSSAAATTTVTIANAAPVVTTGADAETSQGASFALTTTFTDVGGAGDGPWTWRVTWGDGSAASIGSTSVLGGPIVTNHTYHVLGTYTARVTVTDKDGGAASDDAIVTVTPGNESPVANPGGPYQADQTVVFSGAGSSDPDDDLPLTYSWNFGDGSPLGTGVSPTKTYTSDGSYTVTLVVKDALGLESGPVTTTATITNVAPTVTVPSDVTLQVGSSFTMNGSFTDPGGAADGPWNWTIAWGDGATDQGTASSIGPITATHVYTATGTRTARLTVTDKDGGFTSDEMQVQVSGVVIVGAGNVARCDRLFDEQTALLLDGIPGTVFTLGDNIYAGGALTDYQNCFGPSWGRHLSRTRPAQGDEDYRTPGAPGFYEYFGAAAGEAGKGYYSYNLGTWHIVVLNTGVPIGLNSAQDLWLKADLAATTQPCILAVFHFPRFSSFGTAVRSEVKAPWDALYAAGADVVLNGHYRTYERFAPQTPLGAVDNVRGIRQFIVGTGGQGADGISTTRPNTQAFGPAGTYGVLKLALDANSYTWEFVPIAGQTYTDTGTSACH